MEDMYLNLDPKFIKPDTLLEYEHSDGKFNKILGSKSSSSKNLIIPMKKAFLRQIEKQRKPRIIFKQLSSEERNRTPHELFAVVADAKKSLEEGSMTLNECYSIMKQLSDTIINSRDELEHICRVA